MKNKFKVFTLFTIVALMIMLVAGSVFAQEGEVEVEPEPDIGDPDVGGATEVEPEPDPQGAAVRIDFEMAPGHSAKRGHYSVQDIGGGEIASWYALDGWLDSGWIDELPIVGAIHVQVLYYPGPDTEPTVMRILNHAPDSEYGWLAGGTAHALEVAWPDQPIEGEVEPQ